MRNGGALVSLARLKTHDDYTYMHSVAVCALMIALARQLGQDEDAVREAGTGRPAARPGQGDDAARGAEQAGQADATTSSAIIKTPPRARPRAAAEGRRASAKRCSTSACTITRRLTAAATRTASRATQISLHARMGAVCDVYDAITSNRPYKQGWDPAESIAQHGRVAPRPLRRGGVPGLRQEPRHLPDRLAGAHALGPARGGRRAERRRR